MPTVDNTAAPAGGNHMSSAPKDRPILAYCDHEADKWEEDGCSRLTLYAAHAEGLSHAPTGFHIVEWGGAWQDCAEDGGAGLPDWWFVAGSEFEVAANPVKWWPLPAVSNDAAIRRQALEEAVSEIERMPRSVERLGGQRFSYVQLGDAVTAIRALIDKPGADPSYQNRVRSWVIACFGAEIGCDKLERGDRLLEEVLELLQSGGYSPARVAALTQYVWNRPVGEPAQELGGVMVTLAAYATAHGLDITEAGETELARVWTKTEAIRAKQAAKPAGSALPIAAAPSDDDESAYLRAALAPFAKAGELFDAIPVGPYEQSIYMPAAGAEWSISEGDLRRARAAWNRRAALKDGDHEH